MRAIKNLLLSATMMLVFAVAFLVPSLCFPATAAAADLSLNDYSITLAPGDDDTITGTLDVGLDIDDVEWEITSGDDVVSIDIDIDGDTFDATITADDGADDGDECTITFTVTDEDLDDYEVELDVSIEEGSGSSDVEVKTNSASDIGADYATLNGEIVDDNGLDIDEFGFYYGTDEDEVADGDDGNSDVDEADGDEDDFYLELEDLDENETYYFMAYAIDEDDDIAYGSVKSFETEEESVATTVFTLGSTLYNLRGTNQVMDVAPYAKDNRTYLPVRYVAYAMGLTDAQILWSPLAPQTVILNNGSDIVILNIGSRIMYSNGTAITMDVAPEVRNNRTCLPIAWVAQAFGYTATWDGALKVTISGSGSSIAEGEVTLDDDSITLEPGEDETITGTLDADGRDIDDVEWDIDGDNVVSVDVDIDGDTFDATIEVDNDADDGDECTITFTVTDEDGNEYEVELDVTVEEDSSEDFSFDEDSLTLEPGEDQTIVGTLDVDSLDIDDVEWDIDNNVVSISVDYNGDTIDVTIEADDDADGEECTIDFIITDEDGDTYEASVDVSIEA